MRHIVVLLLALSFNTISGVAQDIITTNEGEDILGKVSEISKTEIKYKKHDNLDGPTYTLLKSDVLMIRYENGSKEIFKEEPKTEAEVPSKPSGTKFQPQGQTDAEYLSSQKLAYAAKAEKYRRRKGTGATLTILGGVLFVVGVATLNNVTYYSNGYNQTSTGNPEAGALSFMLGAAGLGVGIPFWIVGAHNQKKYTAKLEGLSFRFNASPNGKGLTLAYRF